MYKQKIYLEYKKVRYKEDSIRKHLTNIFFGRDDSLNSNYYKSRIQYDYDLIEKDAIIDKENNKIYIIDSEIELHEENRDLFIIKNNISKKLHEEEYDLIKKYIPKLNYVL